MAQLSAIELEEWLIEREALRLHAIARAEVERLVEAGWKRTDAVLFVWASPKWPYAADETAPKGIL